MDPFSLLLMLFGFAAGVAVDRSLTGGASPATPGGTPRPDTPTTTDKKPSPTRSQLYNDATQWSDELLPESGLVKANSPAAKAVLEEMEDVLHEDQLADADRAHLEAAAEKLRAGDVGGAVTDLGVFATAE